MWLKVLGGRGGAAYKKPSDNIGAESRCEAALQAPYGELLVLAL